LNLPKQNVGLLLALSLMLTACSPAPDAAPTEPAGPSWSVVQTLARAPQGGAPAIWTQSDGSLRAAWIGSDAAGVHHDAVAVRPEVVESTVVLPLPPRVPRAQIGLPSLNDALHLLWLDLDEADQTPRLFSALLTPDLQVERGPTPVSDQPTQSYDAISAGGGRVIAAWTGGNLAEPALFWQQIDETGLPFPPQRLAENAHRPALLRLNDGRILLFWLNRIDQSVYRAEVGGAEAPTPIRVGTGIALETSEYLDELRIGMEHDRLYLFWNITQGDGAHITRFASAAPEATQWPTSPQPLQLADSTRLFFAAPLAEQNDQLWLTATTGSELVLIEMQDGQLKSSEVIQPETRLLSPARLLRGLNNELYAGYAAVSEDGLAELQIAVRR
jgi:hypothetical protein